ncbi:thioredoxin-like domain-containing protein [Myroides indicus]|uniref:Thioredoxin-like fold domain-containing protein n=1 Tax=Myroides indicus TaxID=1323422 RepID=A0A4R7FCY1_9FLAO|nr:thioredoxin-like domain-containing protein [Myroides indicus]TDS65113.1 hypothetical protein C8P70_103139 [Myroides indicus]
MYIQILYKYLFFLSISTIILLASCQKKFEPNDFSAYFQGEIQNPTTNYVLFCKDNEILDTLFLNSENKFSKKFDSLPSGMYIYKIEPEFQYIYFDKNDSLTVRLNANDFDHSIIFSGRGSEKNNFLMNLNVKNIVDESNKYENFDQPLNIFLRKLDSTQAIRTTYYLKSKAIIGWDENFDLYAKTKLDLHFYSQKEVYPLAHYIRTGENVKTQLPSDYYNFRKRIDFNNENLTKYSSFTRYLSIMLNSIVNESEVEFDSQSKFDKNIEKLNIVDTLIQNQKVKNAILNNIAFIYLLEDQNIYNNDKFLTRYFELSTDNDQHNEILQIQKAVQNLKDKKKLPNVPLVDTNNRRVIITQIIKKPTLIFFWTKNGLAHAEGAHRRAINLLQSNPDIQIISICIDGEQEDWKKFISKFKQPGLIMLRSSDFNIMKDKWIITKIQRSMILDSGGKIINPFINIFDKNIQQIINNKTTQN